MKLGLDQDIVEELAWTSTRKAVAARPEQESAQGAQHGDAPGSYLASVSLQERNTLADVWEKFPAEAVDTKNYASARIVKSATGALPTLTKGQGFLFSPFGDEMRRGQVRWFTMSELFEAMGYPVSTDAQVRAGFRCQFSKRLLAPEQNLTRRTLPSLRSQLGNGWHLGAFTANSVVMMWACQCLGSQMAQKRGGSIFAGMSGMSFHATRVHRVLQNNMSDVSSLDHAGSQETLGDDDSDSDHDNAASSSKPKRRRDVR